MFVIATIYAHENATLWFIGYSSTLGVLLFISIRSHTLEYDRILRIRSRSASCDRDTTIEYAFTWIKYVASKIIAPCKSACTVVSLPVFFYKGRVRKDRASASSSVFALIHFIVLINKIKNKEHLMRQILVLT